MNIIDPQTIDSVISCLDTQRLCPVTYIALRRSGCNTNVCRELFHSSWKRQPRFLFVIQKRKITMLKRVLSLIEKRLKIKRGVEIITLSEKRRKHNAWTAVKVQPSLWWRSSELRRQFLTLVLRAVTKSPCYKKLSSLRQLKKVLLHEKLFKATETILTLFLKGYTKNTGYVTAFNGWCDGKYTLKKG